MTRDAIRRTLDYRSSIQNSEVVFDTWNLPRRQQHARQCRFNDHENGPLPAKSTAANHPAQTAKLLAPLSFALLLLPFAGSLRKRGRNVIRLLCLALALAGIAGLSGCSSNTLFSPQKQSYNVTITATAGSLTQTAALTITVE
jgi:hypothetical protein